MSLYRTLWILAHTPLVTPEAARQATHGIPLTTFLEYPSLTTPPTTPDSGSISSPSGNNILSLSTSTRTGGPSAHTHVSLMVLGSIYNSPTNPIILFFPLRRTKWLTRRRRSRAKYQIPRQAVRSARRVEARLKFTFTAQHQKSYHYFL